MDVNPQIFTAKVMHRRLFPIENRFAYRVYYLVLPLPAEPVPGWLAKLDPRDLGHRNGADPGLFAREILADYGLAAKVRHVVLVTMPRVLGHVFNPVSFYLCLDGERSLRAVIAEVHNTFGEQHSYLCARADHDPISGADRLEAEKLFHVSPFLERAGSYRFRFSLGEKTLGVWIDYFDKDGNRQLLTSLTGRLSPLDRASLRRAFWAHVMVTLKTVALIHWQALKLAAKRVRYVPKPRQRDPRVSATRDLTKI